MIETALIMLTIIVSLLMIMKGLFIRKRSNDYIANSKKRLAENLEKFSGVEYQEKVTKLTGVNTAAEVIPVTDEFWYERVISRLTDSNLLTGYYIFDDDTLIYINELEYRGLEYDL